MDLQTLKNQYAQEQGYEDWNDFQNNPWLETEGMEGAMNEICLRSQKAALEKAAENATGIYEDEKIKEYWASAEGITNPENLIR